MAETWLATSDAVILADGVGDITPKWNYFPWLQQLKDMVGGVQSVGIVVCVCVMVIAAILWGAGKISGAGTMQKVGVGAMLSAFVAAVVIGMSGSAIQWGTDTFHWNGTGSSAAAAESSLVVEVPDPIPSL